MNNMIDDTKEYIIASAIWYDDGIGHPLMDVYGIASGFIIAGFRHANIISILPTNIHYKQTLSPKWNDDIKEVKTIQGFINCYGRFVDRIEARQIAIDCGQVKEKEVGKQLFSEDVFKYQKY